MEIEFKHPETGSSYKIDTDKKFIIIYGKNGSGKTTLSRSLYFDKGLVFNEDFVNSNIYTVSESGATLSPENKKNFSKLWIGEDIVSQSKIVEELNVVVTENTHLKEVTVQNLKLELSKTIGQNEVDLNQFIINDFTCVEIDLEKNSNKFKCLNYKDTSIIDDSSLNKEIIAIKNNGILNLLHSKISKNIYLKELFVNGNHLIITNEINAKIRNLKEYEEKLKLIELILSGKSITHELSTMIGQWLSVHESRTSCLFCGNNDISEAKAEWKDIFDSEAKILKQKLIDIFEGLIRDIEAILADKNEFNKVIAKTINELENLKEKLVVKKGEIESNNFSNFNLDPIESSIELVSIDQKINHVSNYIVNKHIDKLTFFTSNESALRKKRESEKIHLSTLMDENGKKYSDGINEVLGRLGLDKAIDFNVNRRTNPFTYEFTLLNNRELKTLSDGQKHKLALAMFLYSLKGKDYKDKSIVIDDPVVSLDVLSYHQVKAYLINDLISTFHNNGNVSLILLTHNINFLYIQLSNIFENVHMRELTEVYRLGTGNLSKVELDIFRTDDITLFKTTLKEISGVYGIKLLSNMILKTFRIMIDLRLRFRGVMTDEVGISYLDITNSEKAKLTKNHGFLCEYFKEGNEVSNEKIIEGFRVLKDTSQIIGFGELISDMEMESIVHLINDNVVDNNTDKPCFDILRQLDYFLKTSDNEQLKKYIRHPKNTFTKNMVTLSLNNDI
ncbi:MAG TPA: hypothetical protein DIC19_02660 [Erysipelotrichaceae bacterium]|nr:hypothetical protein [Erysipelotrichaceae bacterium]